MTRDRRVIAVFGFDMETDIGSWTPFYEANLYPVSAAYDPGLT